MVKLRLTLPLLLTLLLVTTVSHARLAGQIMVDPDNPSWLVYNRDNNNDGQLDPAFICGPGDPEDFFYRGSRNSDGTRSGDQQSIIDNIIAHGANSIYLQVIRSHGGDGDSSHNPFIDSDSTKDLDEDILSQWDGWLNQLDQAGVVIYFFLYDDSARIWNGDTVNSSERTLINQLVQRYMHLRHLVWVVAEEYSERYSTTRVSNIARAIREADIHDHVIANHQLSSLDFDHANDAYLDQFALQYNTTTAGDLHNGMVTAWNNGAGRYSIMMAESVDHGYDSRSLCRQKNWASALGGAYVMVLRMDGTPAYNDKMNDCRRMASFLEGTDFSSMSPHDELANNGTWMLANPGSSYVAYRAMEGQFRLSGITPGGYLATWFDPVTGTSGHQQLQLTQSTLTLSKPATIGTEAALWLRKTDSGGGGGGGAGVAPAPFTLLLLRADE